MFFIPGVFPYHPSPAQLDPPGVYLPSQPALFFFPAPAQPPLELFKVERAWLREHLHQLSLRHNQAFEANYCRLWLIVGDYGRPWVLQAGRPQVLGHNGELSKEETMAIIARLRGVLKLC